jgi:hypothetical protein
MLEGFSREKEGQILACKGKSQRKTRLFARGNNLTACGGFIQFQEAKLF